MITNDLSKYIKVVHVGFKDALVAGSGTDNTKVTNTDGIDRLGYNSAKLVISANATLAATETLDFDVELSQSEDDSTYTTPVASYTAETLLTGAAGGSTESGILELDIDLSGYDRYLKVGITGDLTASGTDTADWQAVLVLGGAQEVPTV